MKTNNGWGKPFFGFGKNFPPLQEGKFNIKFYRTPPRTQKKKCKFFWPPPLKVKTKFPGEMPPPFFRNNGQPRNQKNKNYFYAPP